jgi:hypothetical protein
MNPARIILAIISVLVACSPAFATAQMPDYLRVGDLEYDLFTNPLEKLYEHDRSSRPRFWLGNGRQGSAGERGTSRPGRCARGNCTSSR